MKILSSKTADDGKVKCGDDNFVDFRKRFENEVTKTFPALICVITKKEYPKKVIVSEKDGVIP